MIILNQYLLHWVSLTWPNYKTSTALRKELSSTKRTWAVALGSSLRMCVCSHLNVFYICIHTTKTKPELSGVIGYHMHMAFSRSGRVSVLQPQTWSNEPQMTRERKTSTETHHYALCTEMTRVFTHLHRSHKRHVKPERQAVYQPWVHHVKLEWDLYPKKKKKKPK